MKMTAGIGAAQASPAALAWGHFLDYFELTKPRVNFLVVVTTLVGFYLADSGTASLGSLALTLLGTGFVAGGASAWNMWKERNLDALMDRTRERPLPCGRIRPLRALSFAILLSASGFLFLFTGANPLAALIAAITEATYVAVYTPLKTRTWWCTLVGAWPGALPVLIGWAAAAGSVSLKAWALFAIVFFWQLPHFFSIGWLYRDDYANAGFSILPVLDETGSRTSKQIVVFTLLLILASVVPFPLALAGYVYLAGALVLGGVFAVFSLQFARRRTNAAAGRLFLYSILYLPVLLFLLMLERNFI